MSQNTFTVGQQLWYVPTKEYSARKPYAVTITKVGKKWLSLDNNHQADKETLNVDGRNYGSPGKCYLSQEEYETKFAIETGWGELRSAVNDNYKPPEGVTAEAIHEARKLLGI